MLGLSFRRIRNEVCRQDNQTQCATSFGAGEAAPRGSVPGVRPIVELNKFGIVYAMPRSADAQIEDRLGHQARTGIVWVRGYVTYFSAGACGGSGTGGWIVSEGVGAGRARTLAGGCPKAT